MLNIVKSSNVGHIISDFLRQSNDLRAEFRTRLLSLGLMQCKSYIVLCGKHVVYMRLPSHKKSKGVSCTGILGPLRLTLVHYELLAKQSMSIGDCLFLPTQLPKTDGATATIRYNPLQHAGTQVKAVASIKRSEAILP